MAVSMENTFQGQHIFVTGSTGFVGKVLIEKILYSLPKVEKLYLMIREKKGVQPYDRLQKELLQSPVMTRLKERHGEEEFMRMCKEKIVPVVGSLTGELLGMRPDDYEMLRQKCTMILHLAATIDFNERLDVSAQLNILGSLQILSLARKCHQRGGFNAFIHVSTCYVNYQRYGRDKVVEETLYPLPFDPEEMTKKILNYSHLAIDRETPRMLKEYGFPNTYTFTKRLSEHLLNKYKGTIPMAIVRPSIIGSSLAEPMPGWIDTLSAAGALFLTAAFGITQNVHCVGTCKMDLVPVDFVVKGILLAAAKVARGGEELQQQQQQSQVQQISSSPVPLTVTNLEKAGGAPLVVDRPAPAAQDDAKSTTTSVSAIERERVMAQKQVPVYQICTSGGPNWVDYDQVMESVRDHWADPRNVPENSPGACNIALVRNRAEFEARFLLTRRIPAALYYYSTKLPYPGARPEASKKAKKVKKATAKAYDLVVQFRPFDNFEWNYMPTQGLALQESVLEPAEMQAWSMDHHAINWHAYLAYYCYGMVKHVVKDQSVQEPKHDRVSGAQRYAMAHL